MTLHDLLELAEINNWDRQLWFQGAALKGDVLIVADRTCASFISNCWLPKMRESVPELRVLVADGQTKPTPVVEKKSIWKAGKTPQPTRLGGLE